MFRLTPSPTFKTLVPLSQPGVERPLDVAFEFRHKSKDQVADWLARMPGRSDQDNLHEVIVSWGIVDDKGEPVPYTITALATLLNNYPTANSEIFAKYLSELTKAKEKNS
jgi:hypothetical protein